MEKVHVPTNRKLMQSDYTNTLVKLEDVFGTFAYQATSSKEQIYEPTANKLIQSVSMDYAYDKYGNVLMQTATYGMEMCRKLRILIVIIRRMDDWFVDQKCEC